MNTDSSIIEKVSYSMTIGDNNFGNVRPGVVEWMKLFLENRNKFVP